MLNTSNSFHSLHFLFIPHFRIPLFLLFVCKYLAFYFSFHCLRNCIYAEFFIHELELEIDRGAVETSFYFLSLVFITKCFTKNLLLRTLQETDEMFVEKCADTFPKSISFGTFSPRLKFLHWLASVYSDHPNLYEAHLRYQLRHACAVIENDFVFVSFHDTSSSLVKKLLEEELELQVYKNKTMKLYETKCTP